MSLTELTATTLAAKLRSREVSAREVAVAFLDRIDRIDSNYRCFLTIDREWTLGAAEEAQKLLDAGEGGPLTGVPIALKDNICTNGVTTTCASKILEGFVPPYDATVVGKLKSAGCVPLGKTNLDEFAMGASTEYSAYQVTKNPWDTTRAPGGSSGGSAAAVAAEMAPLALGSDTGGSIRQPASLCGVVGYKPTYGRCSRYGLVAFGSSLDQIGPLGRTVEDVATLAGLITGPDRHDSTCLDHQPVQIGNLAKGSLKGKRFALPVELFSEHNEAGVNEALYAAIDALRAEGATTEEVSIPSVRYGVTTYYIIAPAEASSNLARFDGVKYGPRAADADHISLMEKTRGALFGHEVRTRIMIGAYALSAGYYDAYYTRAQQVRSWMRAEIKNVLGDHDAILTPTSPILAFKLGGLSHDPLALKLADLCTIPANMGGFPALSLNAGYAQGLPVGLQVLCDTMRDEDLLQMSYAIERALPDAKRRPALP